MLPYEAEIGTNPSLSQIREHVALRKCRPRVRPALMDNEISTCIVRTMSEMWDHEPVLFEIIYLIRSLRGYTYD